MKDCTRCGRDGASLCFDGRWWFHPKCWLVVRTALLTASQIADWAANGRRFPDKNYGIVEIEPAERVDAQPALDRSPGVEVATAMSDRDFTTGRSRHGG